MAVRINPQFKRTYLELSKGTPRDSIDPKTGVTYGWLLIDSNPYLSRRQKGALHEINRRVGHDGKLMGLRWLSYSVIAPYLTQTLYEYCNRPYSTHLAINLDWPPVQRLLKELRNEH